MDATRFDSARAVQLAIALAVLTWRVSLPGGRPWWDWLAVMSGYWLYAVLSSHTRPFKAVTAITMGYVLVMYASGAIPQALAIWSR